MDLELEGARAVISGGSQGIGLAVAEHLLNEGVTVSIAARGKELLDKSVAALSKYGSAYGYVCDVSNYDSTVQWMKDAATQMGGIDIVIHNATGSGQPDLSLIHI